MGVCVGGGGGRPKDAGHKKPNAMFKERREYKTQNIKYNGRAWCRESVSVIVLLGGGGVGLK